ncbi:MAG: response regulator [Cyclobacteriaceae bacterium]|nr:response regulator [Cyclobacteriaceae bacterium HetDA_MAG_MS6]
MSNKGVVIALLLISTIAAKGIAKTNEPLVYVHKGDIQQLGRSDVEWEGLEAFQGFDNSTSVYWIKLERNESLKEGVLLLCHFFDKIESFESLHERRASATTGRYVDYIDRSISKGFYKNAIPLNFDLTDTFYVKLTCHRPESLSGRSLTDLEYLSDQDFEKYYLKVKVSFVLITGMEVVLLLIFLYITYLSRSWENIFYVFLMSSGIMYSIFHFQVFDEFLRPGPVHRTLEFAFSTLTLYSFSAFSSYYLRLKDYSVVLHRIMTVPYILLTIPGAIYAGDFYFDGVNLIYLLIANVIMVIALIQLRKKDNYRVRVFLLAQSIGLAMTLILFLALRGLLPHHFITVGILYIGFVYRDLIFVIDLGQDYARNRTKVAVKEMEVAQLQKEKEELKKIEKLKTIFFNNVSHELRTPLTLLLGPLENTLEERELPNDLKKQLNMSLKNGKYLLQLVNEILDLSKLDQGELSIIKKEQDVVPILAGIIESFKAHAAEKGQTIYFTHSFDKVVIPIDRGKFEKTIINLLSNAIKYSKPNTYIHVKVKKTLSMVTICIEDAGIGIAQKDIEKVFNRYYQVNTSSDTGGTGLGLSIVKEFMDLHGAQVQLTSEIGKGSVFKLTFEATNTREEVENGSSHVINSLKPMDPAKPTILLVEDNHDMRGYLDHQMTEYNIYEAVNGQEALSLLKSIPRPQLIITDYMMPEMDGYTFMKTLKQLEIFASIPIIFLTARTLESDKLNVLNLGVDDYIIKPFNIKELKHRINILLKYGGNQMANMIDANKDFPLSEMATFKNKLDKYIIENMGNSKLSVIDLGYHFHSSESSIRRKVKAATGQSPASYMKEVRLQIAKRRIEFNEKSSVNEVAHEVGMSNVSYFTQAFKKRFGKLPSELLAY